MVASVNCASWLLKSAHAKRVVSSEDTTTEACAVFALRAAALARRTFFLIAGSGFFANLVAIALLPRYFCLGVELLPHILVSILVFYIRV